jgi:hypothetical protein
MRSLALAIPLLGLAVPAAAQRDAFDAVWRSFVGHDVDGDGRAEIEGLAPIGESGAAGAPAVVGLVEAGLLERDADGALVERLRTWAGDVAADGFRVALVAVNLQRGGRHQDGRTVIALRRLLQASQREAGPLAGAVLVGRFPDAFLVRTVNWRKHEPVAVGGVEFAAPVPFLRRVPEVVAPRCDLVLADLDGGWEALYLEAETELATLWAAFPEGVPDCGPDGVPDGGAVAAARAAGVVRMRDFFHVDDGRAWLEGERVVIDDATRDAECSDADRGHDNVIARPEIAVSRIDARGIARSPLREVGGRALFDADGRPVAATFGDGEPLPNWRDEVWAADPALELQLLCAYFDRNHRHRTAAAGDAFRPASIAHGLGSGLASLRQAAAAWRDFEADGHDVRDGADLAELVRWLRRPAVLRTLRAHSDPWIAAFAETEPGALAAELGGPPLCWSPDGSRLVPSLVAATRGTGAGFFLYRTLWENRALPEQPYLMVHTGCEVLAPPGAARWSYDDPRYGAFAHAESLLFFTPCVAMVGRAKVFYDEPAGFCETLGEGATFGDAWRQSFELEASAATWGAVGGDIGRKRAYFWSVIGDWTLRLPRSD